MRHDRFHPTTFVMLVFGLSGMLTGGLLQADVVSFERAFDLSHSDLALRLAFFSALSGAAGGLAGILADRYGSGRIFHLSLVFAGAGLLLFVLPFAGCALIGYLLAGLGIGGLVTGNTVAAEDGSEQPNRSMNLLHAAHGVARLAAIPISIAALGAGWRMSYALLGALFLLLAGRPPAWPSASSGRHDHRFEFSFGRHNRFMAGILIAFFFYMLAEIVLVTWLAAYFEEARGWTPARARAAYGVFLTGLIVGRGAAAYLWPRVLSGPATLVSGLFHLVAISLFLGSSAWFISLAALFILGLCQGPGWTALFALAIHRVPGRAGQVTSFIFLTTCLGYVVSTAGSGFMAQRFGLGSVFAVVAAAHLVFSAIYLLLCRRSLPLLSAAAGPLTPSGSNS
jgi:fucose permease